MMEGVSVDGGTSQRSGHEFPTQSSLGVPQDGVRVFRSTKTYDHSEGLSCCFRQWRATSHCRLLHGYALAFRFVFAAIELDQDNWCFDFGGLKPVRAWLHETFDHTTVVAVDDPQLAQFESLEQAGLLRLRVLPAVGCEAVAAFVFEHVSGFASQHTRDRAWLESVEVREHGGNSAIFSIEGGRCSRPAAVADGYRERT